MLERGLLTNQKVGFSRLEPSSNKNMGIMSDSTDAVLGVSYEDSRRWKKKTFKARCGIALLTIVCTVLVIVLLLTYELRLNCKTSKGESTMNPSNRSLEESVKFLVASDLHFDAYYDDMIGGKPTFCRRLGNYSIANYKAPYGRVGCDSPASLVDSLLNGMLDVYKSSGAEFLLFTGDFSAHKTDASYFKNGTTPQIVFNNINDSFSKIQNTFPKIPIFPVFGNNDLEGHYVLPSTDHDQWYNDTLALFAPAILCSGCPSGQPKPTTMEELRSTFLAGGYYKANIADGRLILLALNSMYWNVYANMKSGDIHDKAITQMNWLEQQLQLARQEGKKVIISSHIPPGIDPYGDKGTQFWLDNYTSIYTDLVAGQYHDVIAGQFFAHIHKDDFKLQILGTGSPVSSDDRQTPANKSFALLMPSLSVVYANNPAFCQFYLDPVKQVLLDYDQYYMDIVMATEFNNPKWQFDYRFSQRYPSALQHIDADRIYELNENLINQSSEATWTNYAFSRAVKYQTSGYSRFGLYCCMRHVKTKDYQKCMAKYKVPGG